MRRCQLIEESVWSPLRRVWPRDQGHTLLIMEPTSGTKGLHGHESRDVIVEGHVRLLLTKKLRRNCHLAARQNVPRSVPVPPMIESTANILCGETVRNSKGMLRDRFLSPGGQVLTKQNGATLTYDPWGRACLDDAVGELECQGRRVVADREGGAEPRTMEEEMAAGVVGEEGLGRGDAFPRYHRRR
jgi:hypothetical protein